VETLQVASVQGAVLATVADDEASKVRSIVEAPSGMRAPTTSWSAI
jgi:hypothetical protein